MSVHASRNVNWLRWVLVLWEEQQTWGRCISKTDAHQGVQTKLWRDPERRGQDNIRINKHTAGLQIGKYINTACKDAKNAQHNNYHSNSCFTFDCCCPKGTSLLQNMWAELFSAIFLLWLGAFQKIFAAVFDPHMLVWLGSYRVSSASKLLGKRSVSSGWATRGMMVQESAGQQPNDHPHFWRGFTFFTALPHRDSGNHCVCCSANVKVRFG